MGICAQNNGAAARASCRLGDEMAAARHSIIGDRQWRWQMAWRQTQTAWRAGGENGGRDAQRRDGIFGVRR
jgi:hypothetical protein